MKKRTYIIIFSLLVSIVSCNEPEDIVEKTDIDTLFVSSNLKKHFYDINTTWIFESNQGEKDTVTLLRTEREILEPQSMHGEIQLGYVENYKFHYLSTRDGLYWDQYIGYVIVRNGVDWANGEYIYLSSYQIGDSSDEAEIDTIYDSYNVSDTTYRNVVRMRINNFEFEFGENWYYYFVDSVGIIRKEKLNDEPNNEIWNLIDRNI
ncbi:MAG: hypothetical protein K8R31_12945 [Bacteroidales bacterium]|nr:hypothetical protein [Bacteroidales bacterium]